MKRIIAKLKAFSAGRAVILVSVFVSLLIGGVALHAAKSVIGWDNFRAILEERTDEILVKPSDKPGEKARPLTAPERIDLAGPFLSLVAVSLTMAGLVLTAYFNFKGAKRSQETALLGSASSQLAMIKSRLDTVLRSTQVEFGKQGLYPGAKERMIRHFNDLLKDHDQDLRNEVRKDIELLFALEALIASGYAGIIDRKGL